MELRQYLNLAWKWLWVIALSGLLAGVASFFASRATTPIYQTHTRLMVGRATQNPNVDSMDLYMGQQLARTYVELVRGQPVLEGAVQSLGLEMSWQGLAGQISAEIVPETQLLDIYVMDSDPYRATAIADAVAQQLVLQSRKGGGNEDPEQAAFNQAQLQELQDKIVSAQDEIKLMQAELDIAQSALQIQDLQSAINLLDNKISDWQWTYTQLLAMVQGGDSNALTVIEQAAVPGWPISPNTSRNVMAAAAIGIAFAAAGALLVEYLDDTVKDPDDVRRAANLPVLGAVARIEGADYPDKLIAVEKPLAPIVEAFRVLRTNIQFSSLDNPARSLIITSANPGEGKSVLAANLAVVMAQSGLRVVIVDADLRKPVQHRIFRRQNRDGLSYAVVQSGQPIDDYVQDTGVENLRLLASGGLPPNPAELLGSERMARLIEELKEDTDMILFDCPPALVVADAAILSTRVDGVILVCDAGSTRSSEARRAVEELRRVHANILGVVLNRLNPKSRGYYYYHTYYSRDNQNWSSSKKTGRRGLFLRPGRSPRA